MNEKIILEAVSKIEPQIFWMLLKLFGIGVAVLLIRGLIESIAAYLQFRWNKQLGFKVEVRVRGIEGEIVNYNLSWIMVQTKDGTELIAMKKWRSQKWTIINGDD